MGPEFQELAENFFSSFSWSRVNWCTTSFAWSLRLVDEQCSVTARCKTVSALPLAEVLGTGIYWCNIFLRNVCVTGILWIHPTCWIISLLPKERIPSSDPLLPCVCDGRKRENLTLVMPLLPAYSGRRANALTLPRGDSCRRQMELSRWEPGEPRGGSGKGCLGQVRTTLTLEPEESESEKDLSLR